MKLILILILFLTSFVFSQREIGRSGYSQNILWINLHKSTQDSIRSVVGDSVGVLAGDNVWVTVDADNKFTQVIVRDSVILKTLTPDSAGAIIFMKQLSSANTNGGGLFIYADSTYPETYGGVVYGATAAGKQWVLYNFPKNREVNVRDFGAVGDGSTDDRQAIQNADSFLTMTGGGDLLFDQGTYVIDNTVFSSKGVNWRARQGLVSNSALNAEKGFPPAIAWGGAGSNDTMVVIGRGVDIDNVWFKQFEHLQFLATSTGADTVNYGVVFDGGSDSDNTVDTGTKFIECWFQRFDSSATLFDRRMTHMEFIGCRWDANGGHGIHTKDGGFLTVNRFYVDNNQPNNEGTRSFYYHETDTTQTVTQSIINASFSNGYFETNDSVLAIDNNCMFFFQQDSAFINRSFGHVLLSEIIRSAPADGSIPNLIGGGRSEGKSGNADSLLSVTFVSVNWAAGKFVQSTPSFLSASGKNYTPFAIWAPNAGSAGQAQQVNRANLNVQAKIKNLTLGSADFDNEIDSAFVTDNNLGFAVNSDIYGASKTYTKLAGVGTFTSGDNADTLVSTIIEADDWAGVTFKSIPDTTFYVNVREDSLIVFFTGSKAAGGNRTYFYEIKEQ